MTKRHLTRALAALAIATTAVVAPGYAVAALADSAAETGPTSIVEDYAYPGAAGILAQQNIKVISGNGQLLLIDCTVPATGDYGYIRVRSAKSEVGQSGQFCLKASSLRGVINVEVPEVYSVRSDGLTLGAGHPTTATWRVGDGAPQSDSVPLGGILPMGIGTGDTSPPATLLQLVVNGS